MLDRPLVRRAGVVLVFLSGYVYQFTYKSNLEQAILRNYGHEGKLLSGDEAFRLMKAEGVDITTSAFNDVFMSFAGIDKRFSEDEIGELLEDFAEHGMVPMSNARLQAIITERSTPKYATRSFCLLTVFLILFFLWDTWNENHKREKQIKAQERFLLCTAQRERFEQKIYETRLAGAEAHASEQDIEEKILPLKKMQKCNEDEIRRILKYYPTVVSEKGWYTVKGQETTFGRLNSSTVFRMNEADKLGDGQDCAYMCKEIKRESDYEQSTNFVQACNRKITKEISYGDNYASAIKSALGRDYASTDVFETAQGDSITGEDLVKLEGDALKRVFPIKLKKAEDRDGTVRRRYALKVLPIDKSALEVFNFTSRSTCPQVVQYRHVIPCKDKTFILMDLVDGVDGSDIVMGTLKPKGMTVTRLSNRPANWNEDWNKYKVTSSNATAVSKADNICRIALTNIRLDRQDATLHLQLATTKDDTGNSFGVSFNSDGVTLKELARGSDSPKEITRPLTKEILEKGEFDITAVYGKGVYFNFPEESKVPTARLGDAGHYSYFAKIHVTSSPDRQSDDANLHKTPSFFAVTQVAELQVQHLKSLAHNLLTGLKHIHCDRNSVHCDIKPANVMIEGSLGNPDAAPTLKIIDFGNLQMAGHTQYYRLGDWSPPEGDLAIRPKLDGFWDMYGAGATLWTLATLAHPPSGKSWKTMEAEVKDAQNQLAQMGNAPGAEDRRDFLALIAELCKEKAEERSSAADALEHKFVRDVLPPSLPSGRLLDRQVTRRCQLL